MTQLLDSTLGQNPAQPEAEDARSPRLRPPSLSGAELEATGALRELLEACSWPQLHLHIGRGEPFAADFSRAAAAVEELPERPRRLLRLLGLGLAVEGEAGDAATRRVEEVLLSAGLLRRSAFGLATTGWVVAPAFGGEVIMGTPSTYARGDQVGALAYLGTDSLLLAKLLGPLGGRRVLDLGAGCGAQGLLVARGASGAVLTDIDAFSLKVSALNWALNDVAHDVLLGSGDLFSPVEGERFDNVVVLPPYVPTFEGSGVSVTAAGGGDGLAFIRRLLAGVAAVLAPAGELVALAQLLCDDDGPLLAQELPQLAPELEVQLVLVDHHPLQPYVAELCSRLVGHGSVEDPAALAAGYERSLRSHGATGVCTAAIRARHRGGWPVLQLVGPTGALHGGDVLELAPGVTLQGEPAQRGLARGGRLLRPLDPVTAALVAALDGRRSIADSARAAWGTPSGAEPVQLAEQAAHRLGELLLQQLLARATSPRRPGAPE